MVKFIITNQLAEGVDDFEMRVIKSRKIKVVLAAIANKLLAIAKVKIRSKLPDHILFQFFLNGWFAGYKP